MKRKHFDWWRWFRHKWSPSPSLSLPLSRLMKMLTSWAALHLLLGHFGRRLMHSLTLSLCVLAPLPLSLNHSPLYEPSTSLHSSIQPVYSVGRYIYKTNKVAKCKFSRINHFTFSLTRSAWRLLFFSLPPSSHLANVILSFALSLSANMFSLSPAANYSTNDWWNIAQTFNAPKVTSLQVVCDEKFIRCLWCTFIRFTPLPTNETCWESAMLTVTPVQLIVMR